jgi:hypothetical protein
MERKVAELLHEALIDNGSYTEDVSIRDDYSGRGMYGRSTYAIAGDFTMNDVIVAVATLFASGDAQDENLCPDDFTFSQDQMGLGIVIY